MSLTRKRRSTGKVTLADVAQLAGVGTMTVSRALRTPEQVSDKLREKIEAAVQELGYMPNLAASALASASSRPIALVVPNLSQAGCSVVFAGMEGTRPVLVEIQALGAPSTLGTPRRAVVGWDGNRLSMILAVLEAHCGVRFGQHDVYLAVAGGLEVDGDELLDGRLVFNYEDICRHGA